MTIELNLATLLDNEHLLTPDPGSWVEDALCAQVDSDLFFPERGGSTREAKSICQRCEVKGDCLSYALEHDIRWGVWGGVSERERRRIKAGEHVIPAHSETTGPVSEFDKDVAYFTAFGWSQRDIAAQLYCSPGRVAAAQHRNKGAA